MNANRTRGAVATGGKENDLTQKDYYDFREDENTRQVSLVNLLRCACKRWMIILLAGIILGGLFGAYKIVSIHSKKDAMIKAYDTYKTALEDYNKTVADTNASIADLQTNITDRLAYNEESPLMQLNPYNCGVAFAQFRIIEDQNAPLSEIDKSGIMYGLQDDIYYGDICQTVAYKRGTKVSYLNQLLTATPYTYANIISFTVRGQDEAAADSLMDDFIEVIMSKKDKYAGFGKFDLEVIERGKSTAMDTTMQTYQQVQVDVLTKLQTQLKTLQTQLTSLVKPVEVPQYSKKYMLKNAVKLGLVGFFGGAILALIAVCVLILNKGVILSSDEVDGEYGLRTLADFSDSKPGDRSKLAYMMGRIEKYMEGRRGSRIGIVGSVSGKKLEELAGGLNKIAGDSKVELKFVSIPDFMKDVAAYKKLGEMDAVILTEEIGASDYMQIRKEVAMIAEHGTELIGTAYLSGGRLTLL